MAEVSSTSICEEKTITEGKANVFLPNSVFYNPVQEFNRDLTIAVISQFAREHFSKISSSEKRLKPNNEDEKLDKTDKSEEPLNVSTVEIVTTDEAHKNVTEIEPGKKYDNGLRILEGLAASGLRSVRFGLEIPGVKEVVANDFDQNAVSFIKKNIANNHLDGLVQASCSDAAMIMYTNRKFSDRFDVIDLDPYGSPAVFLDAAVQAIKDGGLLCVTCTDTAVLCGNAPETCWAKYGSISLKGKFCHEMALRILLQSIESHANRYSRYTVPLLSVSVDFYVRVFVKVYTGQGKVKRSASKLAMVYNCTGCGSFSFQRIGTATPTKGNNFKYGPGSGPPVGSQCSHCSHSHHVGGPMWAEPMHDTTFVQHVIEAVEKNSDKFKTSARIRGMLSMVKEELPNSPLYYITDQLASVLHTSSPSLLQIRSALMHAGYQVSLSHAAQNSLKTDAPNEIIWDVLRCWVKEHPVKQERLKPGTPVKAILEKEPLIKAVFTVRADANPNSRQLGLLRYQVNPEPDWGPKPRAKRTAEESSDVDKRSRFQGKRKALDEKDEIDYKQFPCKRFQRNECDLGDKCKYAHNKSPASSMETA